MAENVLQLDIWPGDWDLPSIDPNCLAALAYCKFSEVPVKVQKASNTWKSPNGTFPVLRHNDVVETKVSNMFSFLRKMNWGVDFQLSNKQSADVLAYAAMLEGKFLPGFLHIWMIDTDSYENLTRPLYTKATSFPMKFWTAGLLNKSAHKRVYNPLVTENADETVVDSVIYQNARDCLTSLSQKLGSQNFFFGSRPSSLDALVFGYIALLLKAPLNKNKLTIHLRNHCENLCVHCHRILNQYFPPTPEELETKRKEDEKRKAADSDKHEFPNKQRNMILGGVFALIVMVTYAVCMGIVKTEMFYEGESDDLDFDMDDDE